MTDIRVPSQWPLSGPRAKLAFIGEAPSFEEIDKRVPLIGPSGRVFNAMLRSANIDRDEIFITNVFDQMAPDNDPVKAGWLKDEVRAAEAFTRLEEELTKVGPNVIVPMGVTALWAFTGVASGISKYRGAVTPATRIISGAKLVPSYHPAYVIRNWSSLVITVDDFIKAATEADLGPDISYPELNLWVEPTIEDVEGWMNDAVMACPKQSVDIETGWGQITSVQVAVSEDTAFDIPFIDLRKPNKSYWRTADEEFRAWKVITRWMDTPTPKVFQNGTYDTFWIFKKKGIAVRNYRSDTRLRHKVMFPGLPADLASMAATYTRLGAFKMWGGRYQKDTEKTDA